MHIRCLLCSRNCSSWFMESTVWEGQCCLHCTDEKTDTPRIEYLPRITQRWSGRSHLGCVPLGQLGIRICSRMGILVLYPSARSFVEDEGDLASRLLGPMLSNISPLDFIGLWPRYWVPFFCYLGVYGSLLSCYIFLDLSLTLFLSWYCPMWRNQEGVPNQPSWCGLTLLKGMFPDDCYLEFHCMLYHFTLSFPNRNSWISGKRTQCWNEVLFSV